MGEFLAKTNAERRSFIQRILGMAGFAAPTVRSFVIATATAIAVEPGKGQGIPTTVQPGTTAVPQTTFKPGTTAVPFTTAVPVTTIEPGTTAVPVTTGQPGTTAVPVTTAVPITTGFPATTRFFATTGFVPTTMMAPTTMTTSFPTTTAGPGGSKVPEVDAGSAGTALTVLAGAFLIARDRYRSKDVVAPEKTEPDSEKQP